MSRTRLEYDVVSLRALEGYPVLKERVEERLGAFQCRKSSHLQNFANSNYKRYEKYDHSRTYVFLTPSGSDDIDVPAFFSVGKTVLDVSHASNNHRKRLMGDFSFERQGAYLIAELARDDRIDRKALPGKVILDEALDVIRAARAHIGGRFVLVDSQEVVFENLYKPSGFRHLALSSPPKGMEGKHFVTSVLMAKDL